MYNAFYGEGRVVRSAPDGSVFALAYVSGIGDATWSGYGVSLVKYDADLQPVWHQVVKNPTTYGSVDGWGLAPTSDGGVVFVGSRSLQTTDTLLVVKFSSTGTTAWARALPPPLPPGHTGIYYTYATDVEEAANGDLLVVGRYTTTPGGLGAHVTKGFVTRFNATGTVLWSETLVADPDPSHNTSAYDVLPLPEGGVAVLGLTFSGSAYTWLAKLQDDGTVVWCTQTALMQGMFPSRPTRVFRTAAGFDVLYQTGSTHPSLGCLAHLDATGNFLSAQRYDMPGMVTYNSDISPVSTGGYILTGVAYAVGDPNYLQDIEALRIAADGTVIWAVGLGSDLSEQGMSGTQMADGGFLFQGSAAYADLDDYRGTSPRVLLIKTDADGTFAGCGRTMEATVSDTTLTSVNMTLLATPLPGWAPSTLGTISWLESVDVCISTGVAERSSSPFTVGPNPASKDLTVRGGSGTWTHELLDATGRVLLRGSSSASSFTLDVSGVAPGRYVLRSTNANAVHGTAVLVVR
jgi:hypothetical protein